MFNEVQLINVLDEQTYADCHIEGSTNIPFDQLEDSVFDWDRNNKIVVYCANYLCPMSRLAWQKLERMGFKNIWAYEGGIVEWHQMGLPVAGACSMEYLSKPASKAAVGEKGTENIRTIGVMELKKMMKI